MPDGVGAATDSDCGDAGLPAGDAAKLLSPVTTIIAMPAKIRWRWREAAGRRAAIRGR